MRTIEERFWDKVVVGDDCWEWTGCRSRFGYGMITTTRGHSERAHRLSWLIHFCLIPPGVCVLHHCDNPPCVNPDHLFLGTRKDNARDMAEKGRHRDNSATHCKRGHPFDNEDRDRRGNRFCRPCHRAMRRERYKRSGT